MAKPPAPPRFIRSPDLRFRPQIAAALAEGVAIDDMTLCLTLIDTSRLTRDATTPVADISFAGGVMRFLGVKVATGGITESALNLRPVAP